MNYFNLKNSIYLILSFVVISNQPSSIVCAKKDNLKCTVCQKVVKELVQAIEKEDPKKTIQVGSYRIEPDGSQRKSEVQYAASEMHLNEIIESLCNTMDDYAQAKHKETGVVALLKLTEDMDKMSTYDFVPDPELNKGLKSHCENILSDFDEDIVSYLRGNSKPNMKETLEEICTSISGLIKNATLAVCAGRVGSAFVRKIGTKHFGKLGAMLKVELK